MHSFFNVLLEQSSPVNCKKGIMASPAIMPFSLLILKAYPVRVTLNFLSCLSDLNRRPPPYHGDALPTELKQHNHG